LTARALGNAFFSTPITRARALQMALLLMSVTAAAYAGVTLNPIQETVRISLSLSDNQMSLLQGPALAIPGVIAAIPLGLLIDRRSRVRLLLCLTVADVLGSALTAMAPSFWVLLIARSMIGLSSFSVNPVALSLIADLYPPSQRGRANMTMAFAQTIGVAFAFALGGKLDVLFLSRLQNWRLVVAVLTVPLVITVFAILPMREPPRTEVVVRKPSSRDTWRQLWGYRLTVAPLLGGILMGQIALGAVAVWAAPMLSRHFGLASDRVGAIVATTLSVSGALGALCGGVTADISQRNGGPKRTANVLYLLAFLSLPASIFAWLPSVESSELVLTTFLTIQTAISVIGSTLLIIVMPNEIRGLCVSVMTAACVLVGNGFAPVLVSLISSASGDGRMIGSSLSLVSMIAVTFSCIAFAIGRRALPGRASLEK
jgi:MFS family permease